MVHFGTLAILKSIYNGFIGFVSCIKVKNIAVKRGLFISMTKQLTNDWNRYTIGIEVGSISLSDGVHPPYWNATAPTRSFHGVNDIIGWDNTFICDKEEILYLFVTIPVNPFNSINNLQRLSPRFRSMIYSSIMILWC